MDEDEEEGSKGREEEMEDVGEEEEGQGKKEEEEECGSSSRGTSGLRSESLPGHVTREQPVASGPVDSGALLMTQRSPQRPAVT